MRGKARKPMKGTEGRQKNKITENDWRERCKER
jgi:hypothetical protein